jgi:hypothetical protein
MVKVEVKAEQQELNLSLDLNLLVQLCCDRVRLEKAPRG